MQFAVQLCSLGVWIRGSGELECVRGGLLEGTLSRLYFDHLSRKGKLRSVIEKISVQVKKSQSNFQNLSHTNIAVEFLVREVAISNELHNAQSNF
eukprot:scaffold3102_cov123-Isochrysis_galbana.AAC.2